MLQGAGVVLEGSGKIGLGKVPRVTRLGREAEVRETEDPDQARLLAGGAPGVPPYAAGVSDHEAEQDRQRSEKR